LKIVSTVGSAQGGGAPGESLSRAQIDKLQRDILAECRRMLAESRRELRREAQER